MGHHRSQDRRERHHWEVRSIGGRCTLVPCVSGCLLVNSSSRHPVDPRHAIQAPIGAGLQEAFKPGKAGRRFTGLARPGGGGWHLGGQGGVKRGRQARASRPAFQSSPASCGDLASWIQNRRRVGPPHGQRLLQLLSRRAPLTHWLRLQGLHSSKGGAEGRRAAVAASGQLSPSGVPVRLQLREVGAAAGALSVKPGPAPPAGRLDRGHRRSELPGDLARDPLCLIGFCRADLPRQA